MLNLSPSFLITHSHLSLYPPHTISSPSSSSTFFPFSNFQNSLLISSLSILDLRPPHSLLKINSQSYHIHYFIFYTITFIASGVYVLTSLSYLLFNEALITPYSFKQRAHLSKLQFSYISGKLFSTTCLIYTNTLFLLILIKITYFNWI